MQRRKNYHTTICTLYEIPETIETLKARAAIDYPNRQTQAEAFEDTCRRGLYYVTLWLC